ESAYSDQPVIENEELRRSWDRLEDLNTRIEQAQANNDTATAEALQLEKQALLVELRSATGLRGRARQLGPTRPARKAADAVRKTLDHVYKVMKKTMPTLVEHLRASIRREGTSYAYRPDFPARSWHF